MIYYIADMHFGHTNVICFDDRPFADTEQMDEVLIQNWNQRTTPSMCWAMRSGKTKKTASGSCSGYRGINT